MGMGPEEGVLRYPMSLIMVIIVSSSLGCVWDFCHGRVYGGVGFAAT
ncbi:MAG: hypothetical protein ACTSRG_23765 [Candidatus Helarchaeota archaeon]